MHSDQKQAALFPVCRVHFLPHLKLNKQPLELKGNAARLLAAVLIDVVVIVRHAYWAAQAGGRRLGRRGGRGSSSSVCRGAGCCAVALRFFPRLGLRRVAVDGVTELGRHEEGLHERIEVACGALVGQADVGVAVGAAVNVKAAAAV